MKHDGTGAWFAGLLPEEPLVADCHEIFILPARLTPGSA